MSIFKIIDERILLNKFLKDKKIINKETYNVLKVYTKYLHEQKFTHDRIRNELDILMDKYHINYIRADWTNMLDSIVDTYTKEDKCEFKKLNTIEISQDELDKVRNVDNLEKEKVMFAMLIVSKAYCNKDMKIYNDMLDIFKLAKYKYDKNEKYDKQRSDLINDLYINKLVDIDKFCTGIGIKLSYIDEEKKDYVINIEITEDNVDSLIYEYLKWRGGFKIINCKECGVLILKTNNNKKYCKKCSAKIKQNNTNKCKISKRKKAETPM